MWVALAKKEIRHFVQRRGTWVYVGICAIYTVIWLLEPRDNTEAIRAIGSNVAVGSLQASLGVLVMIGGLIVSFRAIIGKLESGTINLVVGMPHSRRDIVIGKLVGRTVVITFGIAAAVICAVAGELLLFGTVSIFQITAVTVTTIGYALCWVAIGLAISALARSSTESITGVISASLLGLQWGNISWLVYESINSIDSVPYEYLLVRRIAPREAYHVVTNWILGVGNGDDVFLPMLNQRETDVNVIGVFIVDTTGDSVPLYLTEWASLLVLGLWCIVPLAITLLRIKTIDLV